MQDHFPTQYQHFIATSRYSRWLDDQGRREHFPETVSRYFDYMGGHLEKEHNYKIPQKLRNRLEQSILELENMPSMRCLMTAGPALDFSHVAGYNCSYLPVDSLRSFDECMYILMCGTGVGFSVERKYVNQLPVVAEEFSQSDTTIVVRDSKTGWAQSLKELLSMLFAGQIPSWDTSKVREAGSRLKTFGGRASGPEPLVDLFQFCVETLCNAHGRRLTTLECHDIMCKIGEVVVVGGVRRSALISLSDWDDDLMRYAKSGNWWEQHGYRRLANNSAVWDFKPNAGTFMREWLALYDSKSGERGFFNRKAAQDQAAKYGRREPDHEFGTNPCSEIILRPFQFCNLTEVVVRSDDTLKTLKEKVELATVLGTYQSTLTNFRYLRKIWKKNCEEERLLGVSLTGIMDNDKVVDWLDELREHAVEVNKKLAKDIGINQSVAVTCVKPSGTVSQLVDSASGIHARHSDFYIRRVRADKKDPMTQFMIDQGFPYEDDIMSPNATVVFDFPVKAPENSLTLDDLPAIIHLEKWRQVNSSWCEHKPSITVSVREGEWVKVGSWVYDNFEILSGIAFLPLDEHVYAQAPYESITEGEYKDLDKRIPKDVKWEELSRYEVEDTTTGSQEFACTGNVCEIVDIGQGN